ncbi:TPA: hypothetical protein R2K58_000478 [Raoultella ornithinolytica]|nr:hypothetical protein [Raoultella ornithinolytica]HEC2619594.1 hypothetical protein [Raoultella ornithinolytica]
MTTDITELAQRLATCAKEDAYPCLSSADCGALVEALEKAQQRIDELENDEVRQRLANAEHQLYMAELAKHNLKASRKAQFLKRRAAEQRIADLESRTVKMPKRYDIEEMSRNPFESYRCIEEVGEGDYVRFDDVLAMLTVAGIKWEAE